MNNNILIVGASSDIGIGLIKSIKEESLIIAHYNSCDKKLLELENKIPNKLVTARADLSSENDTQKLLDTVESLYGIPNKIVHLAAPKFRNIRFKDVIWKDFEDEINICLKSLILILNRFLPKLAKLKTGKVVCMLSSVTLNVPPKSLAHYTTVKYAILGLVKSLASEYADKGIAINAISPLMIETKFLSEINEKIVEMSAYNSPLKRNADIKDVVPMINFLLSKEADYINGVNIPVTGGSVF